MFLTQVKKGKDPNAPKRPMSAYMLWLNASREKIKSDHPGISITDLSKKAGEIWKGMSKEKKEVSSSVKGFVGCRVLLPSPACRFACVSLKDSLCLRQEWDRKAEDARRDYEKAMKEYEGGRGDSSKR